MDIILNILWCANGNSKLSSTLLLICQDFYQDFYLVDVKSQSYQVLYTWVGLLYDLGRTMCLLFPIRFSTCYNSIQSMVNWSCSGPDISNCHCSISLSFHIRVGSMYRDPAHSYVRTLEEEDVVYVYLWIVTPSQPSNICL